MVRVGRCVRAPGRRALADGGGSAARSGAARVWGRQRERARVLMLPASTVCECSLPVALLRGKSKHGSVHTGADTALSAALSAHASDDRSMHAC